MNEPESGKIHVWAPPDDETPDDGAFCDETYTDVQEASA